MLIENKQEEGITYFLYIEIEFVVKVPLMLPGICMLFQ